MEAIRETNGEILTVTEKKFVVALKEMSRKGHFIEPTSAATIAGLKKYLKNSKKEVTISSLTGTGLKSVEKIPRSVATKDLIETLRFAQGKCNLYIKICGCI